MTIDTYCHVDWAMIDAMSRQGGTSKTDSKLSAGLSQNHTEANRNVIANSPQNTASSPQTHKFIARILPVVGGSISYVCVRLERVPCPNIDVSQHLPWQFYYTDLATRMPRRMTKIQHVCFCIHIQENKFCTIATHNKTCELRPKGTSPEAPSY